MLIAPLFVCGLYMAWVLALSELSLAGRLPAGRWPTVVERSGRSWIS